MSLVVNSIRRVAAVVCLTGTAACASMLAGCLGGGDDNSVAAAALTDGGHAGDATSSDAQSEASGAAAIADAGSADATLADGGDGGPPLAMFSSTSVDFGTQYCGAMPASKALTVTNGGAQNLVVSASLVGSAFTLSPTSLMLPPGAAGALNVTATVPQSSTAGTPITGAITLFTNDPTNANRVFVLSATPTGATLGGNALSQFASSPVGVGATPVPLHLQNTGNAAASFSVSFPPNSSFSLSPPPPLGGVTLRPGDSWNASAVFTPTTTGAASASYSITATGVTCGSSATTLYFYGTGDIGSISGWPATVDFGPANCGGAAPAVQTFTLSNTSLTAAAHVSKVVVSPSGPNGFGTDATPGLLIPAGGQLTVNVTAPSVAAQSSIAPVTGTLVLQTDADSTPHTITLTEEPQGAILAFDTSPTPATPGFGNFGTEILLQSASQAFNVVNKGNAPANVTLTATENGAVSADAGSAPDAGASVPFSVSVPTFTIPAPMGGATTSATQESLEFQPDHANATVGSLAMAVDSTTALCGVLPQPLPLSGSAIGGGPFVTPTALSFGATCGGSAPGVQTFVVANDGSLNLNWTMSSITGPGASHYSVTASAQPGLLIPGASVTVAVSAAAVPSPAPDPSPTALAAQITITTDVPLDPPHVVTINTVPLGDQLSVSAGTLRFGQVPIGTSVSQPFTVTNAANPGSQDANFSMNVAGGSGGVTSYSLQPGGAIAAGGSSSETATFAPSSSGSQPATLSFQTGDPLCTALPGPIAFTGTGTAGALSLSATALAFGTDPSDTGGLVNCGATGLPRSLTLANVGNQGLNITSLTLGKGASSPFTLSVPGASLPLSLAIGQATTFSITPSAIPAAVANPLDASPFSDTLTIATNATGDTPHVVTLTMQARGAIIAAGNPLTTAWAFGVVGSGSIGTFTNTIQNTGNASATVSLTGLSLPQVFGLQSNPTTVAPQSIAALVGQFTPPSPNGTWSDQGQLVVATNTAFCQPLPPQWTTPTITLSGFSNANPVVSVSGNAVFATTNCGSGPPGGQPITLTNATNQAFNYTLKLNAGTYYTLTDGNAGALAAKGTATIVVNPKTITPGPGVLPGSAPYADDLLINVTSPGDAGTQVTSFTVPISWTLNGAVLSLTDGTGPNGQGFYVADTTSGFALRMDNSGTGSANVSFAIAPSAAFVVEPTPPIQVIPNVRALPQLVSSPTSVACPSVTSGVVPNATGTFLFSGPVCQPFPQTSISVFSCAGTY